MNKIFLFAFFLIFTVLAASAQRKQIDSLYQVVSKADNDSNKVKALFQLGQQYDYFKPDSGIIIAQQCYSLAAAIKNAQYQRRSLILLANQYISIGNYTKGMKIYYDALRLADKEHDDYAIIQTYNNIGSTYNQMSDYPKALQYLRLAQQKLAGWLAKNKNVPQKFRKINVYILNNLGETFLYTDKLDSARYYTKAGINAQAEAHFYDLDGVLISDLGVLESKRGDAAAALKFYYEAKKIQLAKKDLTNLDMTYFSVAKTYDKINKPDSAIFYAQKALSSAKEGNYLSDEAVASKLLYELYDRLHNIPLAYKYYKTATQINDSLINKDKIRALAAMDFEEKQRQQELSSAKMEYEAAVRSYVLAGFILVLLLLTFIFWRNGQQRKKANYLLHEQKGEIEATLDQLKATQTQLIQSEKMASLGELTAGIAHEIQNPLNFVNNFSEVNSELVDEMEKEIDKGDLAEIKAIALDIKENSQKINHHGKRADAIVKGMLEHSRAGNGQKEPTDINALAADYLRLSYHGLRAKDKSFNAAMVTHFDETLPKINIHPQDIGRVLLNLLNNAFYAVNQKAKTAAGDYKPEVVITTSTANGQVNIKVKDNGTGIPDAIKEKIMQPFFTTKPTGEGTGLGLSLTYDMIVKGHGGTILVNSMEGKGSEFIIQLPIV